MINGKGFFGKGILVRITTLFGLPKKRKKPCTMIRPPFFLVMTKYFGLVKLLTVFGANVPTSLYGEGHFQ
jgi:hypothetical protein